MKLRPETLAAKAVDSIGAPTHGDHAANALVPPIHMSTTYVRDAAYKLVDDRDYTRDKNPTPLAAEKLLTALEGGAGALVGASGMAAATSVFRAWLRPGSHVIAPKVGYYALRGWIERFTAAWQIAVDFVDTTDLDAVAAALRPRATKLVWIETPANPTWDVTDIGAVAELAHRAGARLAVDSTCATPVHTRPLALGADLVMHSATKYLGGHSDVLAGALVTAQLDDAWAEVCRIRHDEGACIGPFEAWLLLRGMRTLYARVERQSRSALELAMRLTERGVTVCYPGLPAHPQHATAIRQMQGGFGGMLSILVPEPLAVVRKLRVWVPATSLGGVESLVEHRASVEGPNSPTPPELLRLSVGLEHVEDLFEDLASAASVKTATALRVATCMRLPEVDVDAAPLATALAAAGFDATLVAWDDPAADWSAPIPTVIRSTWNYALRVDAYLAWIDRVAAVAPLVNPADVVRGNVHKRYLLELAARGVPVVPTTLVDKDRNLRIDELEVLGDRIVIKPEVGAGSLDTRMFDRGDPEAVVHLASITARGAALVQPYVASVEAYGERSIVFIDGELSHAIRKSPRFSGDSESVTGPFPIADDERAVALAALAPVADRILYARCDLARDASGAPMVMELELVEPSLFFARHPGSAERYVAGLRARLSAVAELAR